MPLFICSDCGSVDNSALGHFWSRQDNPLCSECAFGAWHDKFPKEAWDGETKVRNPPHGQTCTKCGNGPIRRGDQCFCGKVAT